MDRSEINARSNKQKESIGMAQKKKTKSATMQQVLPTNCVNDTPGKTTHSPLCRMYSEEDTVSPAFSNVRNWLKRNTGAGVTALPGLHAGSFMENTNWGRDKWHKHAPENLTEKGNEGRCGTQICIGT